MYQHEESYKVGNCSTVGPATVNSELENLFPILDSIECKLFFSEPEKSQTSPNVPTTNKVILVRNGVTEVYERLIKINEALEFLGK